MITTPQALREWQKNFHFFLGTACRVRDAHYYNSINNAGSRTTNRKAKMTTAELIQAANEFAQRRAECFGPDCYKEVNGYLIPRTSSPQWAKAIEKRNAIPAQAECDGVICESEPFFRGKKLNFRNRFYIRKADGYRGTFSKAKAVAKLG